MYSPRTQPPLSKNLPYKPTVSQSLTTNPVQTSPKAFLFSNPSTSETKTLSNYNNFPLKNSELHSILSPTNAAGLMHSPSKSSITSQNLTGKYPKIALKKKISELQAAQKELKKQHDSIRQQTFDSLAKFKTYLKDQFFLLYSQTKLQSSKPSRDNYSLINKLELEKSTLNAEAQHLTFNANLVLQKNQYLEAANALNLKKIKQIEEARKTERERVERMYEEIIKNMSSDKTDIVKHLKAEFDQSVQSLQPLIDSIHTENQKLEKRVLSLSTETPTQSMHEMSPQSKGSHQRNQSLMVSLQKMKTYLDELSFRNNEIQNRYLLNTRYSADLNRGSNRQDSSGKKYIGSLVDINSQEENRTKKGTNSRISGSPSSPTLFKSSSAIDKVLDFIQTKELTQEFASLKALLEEENREKQRLERDYSEMNLAVDSLKETAKEKGKRITSLERELSEVLKEHSKWKENMKTQQLTINQLEFFSKKHEKESQALAKERNQLQEALNKLQSAGAIQSRRNSSSIAEANVPGAIFKQEQEVIKLKKQSKELQAACTELRNQLQEAASVIEKLDRENKSLVDEVKLKEQAIDQAKTNYVKVLSEIEAFRVENSTSKLKMKEQMDNMKNKINEKAQVSEMLKDIDDQKHARSLQETEINKLHVQINNMTLQMHNTEEENRRLQNKLNEERAIFQSEKQKLLQRSELKSEVNTVSQVRNQKDEGIKELLEKIAVAENESIGLRTRVSMLENDLKEQQKRFELELKERVEAREQNKGVILESNEDRIDQRIEELQRGFKQREVTFLKQFEEEKEKLSRSLKFGLEAKDHEIEKLKQELSHLKAIIQEDKQAPELRQNKPKNETEEFEEKLKNQIQEIHDNLNRFHDIIKNEGDFTFVWTEHDSDETKSIFRSLYDIFELHRQKSLVALAESEEQRKKIAELSAEVLVLKENQKTEQQSIRPKEEEIGHLNDRIRALEIKEQQLKQTESQLDYLRQQLAANEHKDLSKEPTIVTEIQEVSIGVGEHNQKVEELNSRVTLLKSELEALHKINADLSKELKLHKTREQDNHDKSSFRDQAISQLENQIAGLLTENEQLKKSLVDFENRILELSSRHENEKARLIQEKNFKISDLEAALVKIQKERDVLEQNNQQIQVEHRNAFNKLADLEQQRARLQNEINESLEKITVFEKERGILKDQNDELSQKIVSLGLSEKAAVSETHRLTQELTAIRIEKEELETNVKEMELNIEGQGKSKQLIEDLRNKYKEKEVQYQTQIAELKNTYESALNQERAKSQTSIDAKDKLITVHEDSNRLLKSQFEELQRQLKDKEDLLLQFQSQTEEIENCRKKVEDLEERLGKTTAEKEQLDTEILRLKQQIEEIERTPIIEDEAFMFEASFKEQTMEGINASNFNKYAEAEKNEAFDESINDSNVHSESIQPSPKLKARRREAEKSSLLPSGFEREHEGLEEQKVSASLEGTEFKNQTNNEVFSKEISDQISPIKANIQSSQGKSEQKPDLVGKEATEFANEALEKKQTVQNDAEQKKNFDWPTHYKNLQRAYGRIKNENKNLKAQLDQSKEDLDNSKKDEAPKPETTSARKRSPKLGKSQTFKKQYIPKLSSPQVSDFDNASASSRTFADNNQFYSPRAADTSEFKVALASLNDIDLRNKLELSDRKSWMPDTPQSTRSTHVGRQKTTMFSSKKAKREEFPERKFFEKTIIDLRDHVMDLELKVKKVQKEAEAQYEIKIQEIEADCLEEIKKFKDIIKAKDRELDDLRWDEAVRAHNLKKEIEQSVRKELEASFKARASEPKKKKK